MTSLYPLRFDPIFQRYLWGGRRLQNVLGKPLGEGDDYAESWEIVDRDPEQSVVAAGPLAGATLRQLVEEHRQALLGSAACVDRFPLLLKFLDAQQTLSVQVHPNDEQAARLDPPDLGKTEAWVVLAAEPGSVIYAGLHEGVDRAALAQAIADGTTNLCLHRFKPRVGDCVLVPAGIVHAIGAGLLIAEIQQASDTTFRLFDWNRLDKNDKPRPLHVEQALEVIDFAAGPVDPIAPQPTDRPGVERLVACDKFVLERWRLTSTEPIGGDDRCRLLAVTQGSVAVEGDPTAAPLQRGQSMLLPAALGPVQLTPDTTAEMLVMCLPEIPSEQL